MEFDTVRLISSAVFAVCAGSICNTLTKGIMHRKAWFMIIICIIAGTVGAWGEGFAYVTVFAVMSALLAA